MKELQKEYMNWAKEVSEKIKKKSLVVADRSRHKIPYTTENGVFNDCSEGGAICWWTNGFYGGMMWQLYHATGEELYKEIALEIEKKLDKNLMTFWGMDHDSGFKWLTTAVANYRLTGSEQAYNRGRLAADNLMGRFNLAGRFIRAWNDSEECSRAGWAIIDCMMNLPLLYWAYEETKDPRYLQVAVAHADTAEKYFIRPDGSANHIVEFDPFTGEFIKSHGGQGVGVGSSWTRGQAWAIYGFALSYLHTKNEKYLNVACKVADYFIYNIPDTGFIPVDFRQPADCTLEDSTAAAIAACGMLEIAKVMQDGEVQIQGAVGNGEANSQVGSGPDQVDKYFAAAVHMLKNLAEHRCNWSRDCDNILEKCTAAFHDKEHEFSIIYGDYYFIEAIFKLTGEELFIW